MRPFLNSIHLRTLTFAALAASTVVAPTTAAVRPEPDCRHLEMRLVPVLDIGNEADSQPQRILGRSDDQEATAPPAGAIERLFLVGKFEVTVAQWVIYLNSVSVDDTHGLYSEHWATDGKRIDSTDTIARDGVAGSYSYSALRGGADEPMRDVSWRDAIRFVNWLENSCPTGAQTDSTTEAGTYAAQLDPFSIERNPDARVWLPERDEWLKAGFFSPVKDGRGRPGWHMYSTQSDEAPLAAPDHWQALNSANYERILGTCPPGPDCHADAEAYGDSESFYGTRNQGGNVWEWVENRIGVCGEMRGGAHNSSEVSLSRLIGLAACILEFGIDHRLPDAGLRIGVAVDEDFTRFEIVPGGTGITLR